jgi:hypothetical protein
MPPISQECCTSLGLAAVAAYPDRDRGRRGENDGGVRRYRESTEKFLGARGTLFVRAGIECRELAP